MTQGLHDFEDSGSFNNCFNIGSKDISVDLCMIQTSRVVACLRRATKIVKSGPSETPVDHRRCESLLHRKRWWNIPIKGDTPIHGGGDDDELP